MKREELDKELTIAIGDMNTAKLALRATAPLSLRCKTTYAKYQALRKKVNDLLKQMETSNNILGRKNEGNKEQSKSRGKRY